MAIVALLVSIIHFTIFDDTLLVDWSKKRKSIPLMRLTRIRVRLDQHAEEGRRKRLCVGAEYRSLFEASISHKAQSDIANVSFVFLCNDIRFFR
mmetsp:Transcript_12421/g.22563  ORF Transcript_12421/g.22563 Transcript_12421/m.22563 type:complete len:94 (+) Transcript_12421:350-631(+)